MAVLGHRSELTVFHRPNRYFFHAIKEGFNNIVEFKQTTKQNTSFLCFVDGMQKLR